MAVQGGLCLTASSIQAVTALFHLESIIMARKPNYRFERMERDKNKASKKLARQKAKEEKSDQRKTEAPDESTDEKAPE